MGFFDFFRKIITRKSATAAPGLKEIWRGFQQVLAGNSEVLTGIGDLEERLLGHEGPAGREVRARIAALDQSVGGLVAALEQMSGGKFPELEASRLRIREAIHRRLEERAAPAAAPMLVRLEEAAAELLPCLGGKAANLAWAQKQLGAPVPPGVVATLTAYKLFMEQPEPGGGDRLWERLRERLAALDLADENAVGQASRELQALVMAQPLPEELSRALVAEARRLSDGGRQVLIVRSSGGREDVSATFAGQYESFVAATPEEVPERWRQVVASQFGDRAIIYFHLQGLAPEEAAMAVLVQPLVDARAAGVMFTADADRCEPGRLVTSAVWGLAADLVSGKVSADEYFVAKQTGHLLEARLARKEYALAVRDGVLVREAVTPELLEAKVMEEADLARLADLARSLEEQSGCPHVVEWVQDRQGELFVVQLRHLPQGELPPECPQPDAQAVAGAEVLLATGRIASEGAAAGPVFRLTAGRSLAEVPPGVVLAAPRTTPQLAPVLPRVAALVTDVGAPTGHLALVAREYGVPALVDTAGAMALPEGEVVTVDAYQGKVYRGRLEALLSHYPSRPQPQGGCTGELEQLRAVAELIIPLHLVDRRTQNFRPEYCRTYHDIARFAHEKAMQEMFSLMDEVAQGRVPALRLLKLKTTLPLNLHLVDLGDGLASHETPVPPADILSRPMRALWRGISHPDIAWAGPVPVNVGGFLQVLGQSAIRPPEKFWDKTYAIVAANYVNYACRLGYHFQSVDSYIGKAPADNYINFTFKGGAADDTRRIRRIRLIATVLERLGFELEIHGDVIRGRFRRRTAAEMEERLDILGRLMAYVRQLDMLMCDDAISQTLAERFLAGHYERPDGAGTG
jgi:pyruvate, water dikinase